MINSDPGYRRPDIEGGQLKDKMEIAYYKQVQANDVINNKMLGDYNDKGNYVVNKKIVDELIGVIKVVQHTYGKTIFCTSNKQIKSFGYLEFAIKVERETPQRGKATATLELLESIDKVNGYYQNINTVLIATFVDNYDNNFLKNVYEVFNIVLKDDYKGRKKLDDSLEEIIARKDYLAALQMLSEMGLGKVEREFYEARIEALKKGGEYGKAVLKNLEEEIKKVSKLFLNPTQKNYHKSLNQLLDKVMEGMKPPLNKEFNEQMDHLKDLYIKQTQAEFERARNEQKQAALPKDLSQIIAQNKGQEEARSLSAKTEAPQKTAKDLAPPVVAVKAEIINNPKQNTPSFESVKENKEGLNLFGADEAVNTVKSENLSKSHKMVGESKQSSKTSVKKDEVEKVENTSQENAAGNRVF